MTLSSIGAHCPCYSQGNLALIEPEELLQVIVSRSHCVPCGQQCCLSLQHVACKPHTQKNYTHHYNCFNRGQKMFPKMPVNNVSTD